MTLPAKIEQSTNDLQRRGFDEEVAGSAAGGHRLRGLAVAGCGEDKETTTTAAPTTTEAPTTTTQAPTTTTEAPTTTTTAAPAILDYTEAIDHEGETITATGPVVGVDDKGDKIGKILVQIGSAEKGEGLNAMVLYADVDKFGGVDALKALKGKIVNVTGEVTVNAFELKAEIPCTDPSQIEVVGEVPGAAIAMDYTEAIDHEGETITATGPVVGVDDKGDKIGKILVQIGSAEKGEGLNAMVLYADVDKFGGVDALKALEGKTLVVTGEVTVNAFELKAEIPCTDPFQIAMVEDDILDYTEAIDHEGETITATGPVVGVDDKGDKIGKILVQIGSAEKGEGLNAMVLYADVDKFGGVDALKALEGKTLVVTGEVTVNAFELKAEIPCTALFQIGHWRKSNR